MGEGLFGELNPAGIAKKPNTENIPAGLDPSSAEEPWLEAGSGLSMVWE